MRELISLDMFQTAGVGVLALLLGMFFTRSIPFLKRFCIPAPVSGGILISLLTLVSYSWLGVEFSFDSTIRDISMMLFFTSVGFQSDFKAIKKGGKPLIIMVVLVAVLIVAQNLISVGTAKLMGLDPLLGMASGSIPMAGGHGTSGGFSPLLDYDRKIRQLHLAPLFHLMYKLLHKSLLHNLEGNNPSVFKFNIYKLLYFEELRNKRS